MQLGQTIRPLFPFFKANPGITYLDSAATSLKPEVVIEGMRDYYERCSVNVHRGLYNLSETATTRVEAIRTNLNLFLGGNDATCVIFTRGTTESLNLLSYSLGNVSTELADVPGLTAWQTPPSTGDVILLSESEHHANLVPWQMLAKRNGMKLAFLKIRGDGVIDLDYFQQLKKDLSPAVIKIIALSEQSNVTGIYHDLQPFTAFAREKGSLFIIDAAQSVCHEPQHFADSGAHFIAFSAHKMLGPTGLGGLCGYTEILNRMPPFQGGGGMIATVKRDTSTYLDAPTRFEAGTIPIGEIFAMQAVLDFHNKIGWQAIHEHDQKLLFHTQEALEKDNVTIYGPGLEKLQSGAVKKSALFSFSFAAAHPHDIATLLDEMQICVRAGHHCCQLLMAAFQIPATTRASFNMYNDIDDIEKLVDGLRFVKKILVK